MQSRPAHPNIPPRSPVPGSQLPAGERTGEPAPGGERCSPVLGSLPGPLPGRELAPHTRELAPRPGGTALPTRELAPEPGSGPGSEPKTGERTRE